MADAAAIGIAPERPVPSWLRVALRATRSPGLPLTLRKKLGALLPVPDALPFRAAVFEGTYLGRTGSHLDEKVWRYGLHEPATIRLMRAILRADRAAGRRPVLLDVGTNSGLHLIACAGLADRALGFEPWDPARGRALASVAVSGFHHVRVLPFGLGEADAVLPFEAPAGDNLGVGSFASGHGALRLQVRRGDAVCAEEGIAPTLIKIDTEGLERPVLAGLAATLAAARPAVVLEVGGDATERAALVRDLGALLPSGYRLLGLRRGRERPALFALRPGGRCENALAWPGERPLPG